MYVAGFTEALVQAAAVGLGVLRSRGPRRFVFINVQPPRIVLSRLLLPRYILILHHLPHDGYVRRSC